jgi:hypothetical protein
MKEIKSGKFVIKDSGKRQQFKGGAVRDVDDNKPRYELIPVTALKRVALHYTNGARKYDDDNWSKGIPFRRIYGSLMRHCYAFGEGEKSEDHLAAIVFNAMAIMHFQETGRTDLDDMPKYEKKQD